MQKKTTWQKSTEDHHHENLKSSKTYCFGEISSSHGGACEDDCLLGCCDVSEVLAASIMRAISYGGSKHF
jgi:hypothetical protein